MTDELLFKYFSNEASAEEVAQIEQWLDEDPARQSEFDSAHYLFNAMILHSDELSKMTTPGALEKTSRKSKVRRLVYRYAAAAAAVVIAGLSGVFVEREINYNKMTAQTNVLNGNSRIEYPVIFSRKQRNVKLSGEAFFEVKHDERHPFIVETFASKVEVLGTRFNVYADEASEYFSAALVDGKVKVTTNDENVYGVKIVIERETMPEIGYKSGKIRVSEGVHFALKLLQHECKFTYTENYETNTITIR